MSAASGQIRFPCPACGRAVGIAARMAGRTVTCPACQMRVVVPDGEPSASPPPRETGTHRSSAAMMEVGDDAGFVLKPRRTQVDEMDLTPMVDVTFLLLIFFMITASFSLQKTLEVPPPDPESQGSSPVPLEQIEESSVVVRVEPDDVYFVDDRPVASADDLAASIAGAMADGTRSELVIEAADAARHESVVKVYDAGNEVGMQRIRLASPPPET